MDKVFGADIELIIFDFDGVIVESNGIKDQVFEELFGRYPDAYDDLIGYHRTHVSASRVAKFDYLLERTGNSGNNDLKESLLGDFSRLTLLQMRSVQFVKGAKAFLEKYHTHIPMYLASVTPQQDLDAILADLQLNGFFKKAYGCPPWTKPGAIRAILAEESKSADRVLLVGDSYGDQQAAGETGIHFIARNSGLAFHDAAPEWIIQDLTELDHYFTVKK